MRTKFILARKLSERIGTARSAERSKVYQRYLFAPEAKVEISFDNGFAFRDGDLLFKVEAVGRQAELRRASVTAVAEAIWTFRRPK